MMDSDLTLTVTGNAFLQGRVIRPFWPDADPFVFCNQVRFAAKDEEGATVLVAGDPDQWLGQLKAQGAELRVHIVARNEPEISDLQSVGFANGGPRWLIETVRPGRRSDFWEAFWEVTGDDGDSGPDRRIWSVTYWRLAEALAPAPAAPARPLAVIAADLGTALGALAAFVERTAPAEAMPGWADNFRRARAILDADPGPAWQAGDPGPPGFLAPRALAVFHACHAGWVFGGMGSWNDGAYWGEAEVEGDRLSEALFALLHEGLAAVANSSCREAPR